MATLSISVIPKTAAEVGPCLKIALYKHLVEKLKWAKKKYFCDERREGVERNFCWKKKNEKKVAFKITRFLDSNILGVSFHTRITFDLADCIVGIWFGCELRMIKSTGSLASWLARSIQPRTACGWRIFWLPQGWL